MLPNRRLGRRRGSHPGIGGRGEPSSGHGPTHLVHAKPAPNLTFSTSRMGNRLWFLDAPNMLTGGDLLRRGRLLRNKPGFAGRAPTVLRKHRARRRPARLRTVLPDRRLLYFPRRVTGRDRRQSLAFPHVVLGGARRAHLVRSGPVGGREFGECCCELLLNRGSFPRFIGRRFLGRLRSARCGDGKPRMKPASGHLLSLCLQAEAWVTPTAHEGLVTLPQPPSQASCETLRRWSRSCPGTGLDTFRVDLGQRTSRHLVLRSSSARHPATPRHHHDLLGKGKLLGGRWRSRRSRLLQPAVGFRIGHPGSPGGPKRRRHLQGTSEDQLGPVSALHSGSGRFERNLPGGLFPLVFGGSFGFRSADFHRLDTLRQRTHSPRISCQGAFPRRHGVLRACRSGIPLERVRWLTFRKQQVQEPTGKITTSFAGGSWTFRLRAYRLWQIDRWRLTHAAGLRACGVPNLPEPRARDQPPTVQLVTADFVGLSAFRPDLARCDPAAFAQREGTSCLVLPETGRAAASHQVSLLPQAARGGKELGTPVTGAPAGRHETAGARGRRSNDGGQQRGAGMLQQGTQPDRPAVRVANETRVAPPSLGTSTSKRASVFCSLHETPAAIWEVDGAGHHFVPRRRENHPHPTAGQGSPEPGLSPPPPPRPTLRPWLRRFPPEH